MSKVVVGLSGGVDSSIAAALLKQQGYEVVGAFMKNWSDSKDPITGICSWKNECRDAELVARHLEIPFLTFDFEDAYREAVIKYLIHEYAIGRTPNPDVWCNKLIKFDLFLTRALAEGADFIATGHYARVRKVSSNFPPWKGGLGGFQLLAGVDPNKDQSYFLHQLNQEQLARTIFPLGDLTKPQVRQMAKELALPTANKKDSQGICFVGKVDLKKFLAPHIFGKVGLIKTVEGEVIGQHLGLAPYTTGQRHGFGGGGGAPLFVVEKDFINNILIVARGANHPALFKNNLVVENIHWISGTTPKLPQSFQSRIRYRQPLQKCLVTQTAAGLFEINFQEPQRAITPGQFAVVYDGDLVLGGGVIK